MDASTTIEKYSFLIGLSIPFPLLHGPFLYTYTSLFVNPNKNISYHWLHFLLFILVNIRLIPFYILPASEKLYIFQNDGIGYEKFVIVNTILTLLSGVVYFSMSYIIIHKHRKNIKHKLSKIERRNLDWLRFLTFGIGTIWIFVFGGSNELIFSGAVLFIILIGIFGIRQNNVFSNTENINSPTKHVKYEKSGLHDNNKVELTRRLEKLIETEKPFLNPELSLRELAQKINTQPNHLSQLLNGQFEMNFNDFINSKRVDEFCTKIKNNEFTHYKLIEIAYECGFSSKSVFNRNFKRITGKTPSEYKKEIQNVSSQSKVI
ncbi:AraC family transcriptional regulator [Aquimarina sp. 2201CG1-2-11]